MSRAAWPAAQTPLLGSLDICQPASDDIVWRLPQSAQTAISIVTHRDLQQRHRTQNRCSLTKAGLPLHHHDVTSKLGRLRVPAQGNLAQPPTWLPEKEATLSCGAQAWNSRSQLRAVDSGTTTRCGLATPSALRAAEQRSARPRRRPAR